MMNTENSTSTQMAQVRKLAKQFDTKTIENCMQLALENKANPCYSANETEELMNVLAKANYIRAQMEQGKTVAEAVRVLGQRIRSITN